MAYSESEKVLAVEIVRRNNGVLDTVTLNAIRDAIGKPGLTPQIVRQWLKKEILLEKKSVETPVVGLDHDKVDLSKIVAGKLDEKLEQAAHRFVDHATKTETIRDMSGQQAMTAAAIAIDKMRLLRNLPTEIIGAAPELTELALFFRENGIDMSTAIREWRERLQARKAAQGKVSNG